MLRMATFMFLQFIQTFGVDAGSNPSVISLGSSLVAGAQPPNAWYSESKLFAFGFYPQGAGYVVAIWLTTRDEENRNTVVWTHDPAKQPLSENTTLKLTRGGNLVLAYENRSIPLFLTAKNSISFAVLKNNGNFVLYNHSMNLVWQSFKYPTNTILQGQSLFGGTELVSSVSKTNYSSGRFRIKMQSDGNLVMYPTKTVDVDKYAYWASTTNTGVGASPISKTYLYLNDTGMLQLVDETNSKVIMVLNTKLPYPAMYHRATLDDDGIFRLYAYNHTNFTPSQVWSKPDYPCEVKSYCGFNSYCTTNRKKQSYCVCLPGSHFVDIHQNFWDCHKNFTGEVCKSQKKNVKYNYNMVAKPKLQLDEGDFYYRVISNNKEACRTSCLEDCNCDAALFDGNYCSKYKYPLQDVVANDYTDVVSFFKTASNVSLYVQPNQSVNASSVWGLDTVVTTTTSKKTWVLILVITIGFSIYSCISLSLSGFFVFKIRLLKYKRLLESTTLGAAEDLILRSYTFSELKRATNGFKQELGRGSFGTVYKGSLYKGKKSIAVKRLEKMVDDGEREFRAEMQVIGKTHHKNLVRLLGYCAEGKTHRLLVYEYMSNGTLADCLFKSQRLPDWSERVQIALDVARGILYLHEECETPIIHCDIKPHNILMDDFWTAKISDFGLAKLLMPDQTKTFTMVRGTRGYLAPEWQKNSPISLKVDIFSYGIVLLEIICCRRNLDVQVLNPDEIVLSNWVYKCFERGQLELLVDHEQVEKEALERMIKVGLWCIQDEPAHRPSMKCVLLMLEGITEIATPPCPITTW